MAVLGTLVVLLSAVYGFLLYWIGGGQKGLYLLNALVASFVILILFEPVRSWLENSINRWLLRQRTELRGRLDAVRRELPGVVDVRDMVSESRPRSRSHAASPMPRCTCSMPTARASIVRALIGQTPPERLDANAERALLDRVRDGYLDKDQLAREIDELAARRDAEAKRRAADRAQAPRRRAPRRADLPAARLRRDRARPVAARPVLSCATIGPRARSTPTTSTRSASSRSAPRA